MSAFSFPDLWTIDGSSRYESVMPYDEEYANQTFEGRPFDDEIESCTFIGCDLGEADLGGLLITDTTFRDCDLQMVKLVDARLQDVRFIDSRLMGVAFSSCSDFALAFSLHDCDASFASFVELGLAGGSLKGCVFRGADFSSANLSGADLSGCDLLEATFDQTNLAKANLRGAVNFDIDADRNQIRGAKFSRASLEGLLRKHELDLD